MQIPAFVFELIVWFVWRQVKKFGAKIDWDMVKRDACARIAKVLPGDKWDAAAQAVVAIAIDIVKELIVTENLVAMGELTNHEAEAIALVLKTEAVK